MGPFAQNYSHREGTFIYLPVLNTTMKCSSMLSPQKGHPECHSSLRRIRFVQQNRLTFVMLHYVILHSVSFPIISANVKNSLNRGNCRSVY